MSSRQNLEAMTVVQLKALLAQKGLDTAGRKAELINRLMPNTAGADLAPPNIAVSSVSASLPSSSSSSVVVSSEPPEWAKQLQSQVAALGALVGRTQESAVPSLSKPALTYQHEQLQKIKTDFCRAESAAAGNTTVAQACSQGKSLVEGLMQYTRIADTDGFDVALAFSRGSLVRGDGGPAKTPGGSSRLHQKTCAKTVRKACRLWHLRCTVEPALSSEVNVVFHL